MTSLRAAPDALLPAGLRRTAEEWFGEEGRIWCDALPGVAGGLIERWKLSARAALDGGTHSLVLDCVQASGTPAVLKLPFVNDENRAEADALRLYDGDGAVRLLDHDPATGALLLERLFSGAPLLDLADRGRALDIACGLLRQLRRPAPEGHRFPLLRDLAASWARTLPAEQARLGHPLPDRMVEDAARLAGEFSNGDSRGNGAGWNFVVNRDPHLANFLSARRAPWLLIDPKPVVGEAAFDGSFLLVANLDDRATLAGASSTAERIAAGLAVDPARVRAWAFVRAVDNALWASGLGDAAKTATALAQAQSLAVLQTR